MDVLIVDDSSVMRKMVRRALRQAGFKNLNVREAANGQEALDEVAREKVDMVLSDWNMPEMTGIQLLRAMRRGGDQTRFAFVTSESTPELRARAAAAGALFVVNKPFTPESMRAAFEEAGLVKDTGARKNFVDDRFDAPAIQKMLTELVSRRMGVRDLDVEPIAKTAPAVWAIYVYDNDDLGAVLRFEFELAASMGAALGMRSPDQVMAILKEGTLPHDLRADTYETLNVMARLLSQRRHVRLTEVVFPPDQPSGDVFTFIDSARIRKDFHILPSGFMPGRMSYYQ
ncbi:MAG: response regulator [Myxococcota bacterium]